MSRVDGKVVFIEGAVPGDVVDVRLSKNKKTGPRVVLNTFTAFLPTGWNRSVNISGFVVDVNGRCCHMKSNCYINNRK